MTVDNPRYQDIQRWASASTVPPPDRPRWPPEPSTQEPSMTQTPRHDPPDSDIAAPRRLRLGRAPGWRLPAGAVAVARPGRWGNPYRVGDPWRGFRAATDPAHAVALYRSLIASSPTFRALVRIELAGRDLACWCPLDALCHADVLLTIANHPDEQVDEVAAAGRGGLTTVDGGRC
jgi:uncharacterized protein DUF4326